MKQTPVFIDCDNLAHFEQHIKRWMTKDSHYARIIECSCNTLKQMLGTWPQVQGNRKFKISRPGLRGSNIGLVGCRMGNKIEAV